MADGIEEFKEQYPSLEVDMKSYIRKFKEHVPIPETCPFCGKKLTPENAMIDHIIPRRLGGKDEPDNLRYLCAACNAIKADKYDPLLEYYIRLIKKKGKEEDDTDRRIEYLLRNASNKDIQVLYKRIESKDSAFRRLLAYYNASLDFQKKNGAPEPENDELAESMEARLKSLENYDYKNELREEINGNIFNYQRGFPIEKYIDVLSSYGEEKGEVYFVYLDEDGGLVVY